MSLATDVVDAQVSAYRDRDLERFLACYSPSAVIKDLAGSVVMGGLDVMREQYGQLFRDSPELTVDIPQRIVIGDYVIDEEPVTGFNLPGYPAELHAVVAYQVTAGKISGVTFIG
jgi:hypothetical protein